MNTLTKTTIPGLIYGNVESYYLDHELMQHSRQFESLDELDVNLEQIMSPEKAEKAKTFILHMNSVHYHLDRLFTKIETEMGSSEEAVIRGYLSNIKFSNPNDAAACNDAAILIRNRNLFELDQMGLFSLMVY